jgi:hypothetical protein
MSTSRLLISLAITVGLAGLALAQPHAKVSRAKVVGATTAGVFATCNGPSDCDLEIANRGLACTKTVKCENRECVFAAASTATCACYESDVRLCPANADQLQFCVELGPSTTAWQRDASGDVCGPARVACATGNSTCASGFRTTKFDGNTWQPQGPCVAEPACPAAGTTRNCAGGNPACTGGQQTFDGNAWGACEAIGCPGAGSTRGCNTGRAECPSGLQTWSGSTWGACQPVGCPKLGDQRGCATGRPSCPQGLQTFTASGWSACAGVNCPIECAPGMRPGSSQPCTTSESCGGRQECGGDGRWSACTGPRACPVGWRRDGDHCAWTSPVEGRDVSYFPHRAGDEAVAAAIPLGRSRVAAPVYVEVVLSQWSNPAAHGGGNHCGKGNHPSAWVGCLHPGGGRGWGRDVADHEWQGGVMIPLKCEPQDSVGVFKHSWGHDAFWHCARALKLRVVRNHDPLATCRY